MHKELRFLFETFHISNPEGIIIIDYLPVFLPRLSSDRLL